jgi:hypothetical protein
VADGDDIYYLMGIVDGIEDAIVADAYSPEV